MDNLEGRGTTRNIVYGLHDKIETFRGASGALIVREKDGEVFIQRINRHNQPEFPSLRVK